MSALILPFAFSTQAWIASAASRLAHIIGDLAVQVAQTIGAGQTQLRACGKIEERAVLRPKFDAHRQARARELVIRSSRLNMRLKKPRRFAVFLRRDAVSGSALRAQSGCSFRDRFDRLFRFNTRRCGRFNRPPTRLRGSVVISCSSLVISVIGNNDRLGRFFCERRRLFGISSSSARGAGSCHGSALFAIRPRSGIASDFSLSHRRRFRLSRPARRGSACSSPSSTASSSTGCVPGGPSGKKLWIDRRVIVIAALLPRFVEQSCRAPLPSRRASARRSAPGASRSAHPSACA